MTTSPRIPTQRQQRLDVLMPALIGLAGVLIGALVAAGTTYWFDRDHRIGDERTAKRLLAHEIHVDTGILIEAAAYGKLRGPQPAIDAWRSQAGTLARHLDDDVWGTVSTFYGALLYVSPMPAGRCGLGLPEDRRRQLVRSAAIAGDKAYQALGHPPIEHINEVRNRYGCYSPHQVPE